METLDEYTKSNEHNKRCAEAVRTLKLFIRDAEEKHETKVQISTLKLVLGAIDAEVTI